MPANTSAQTSSRLRRIWASFPLKCGHGLLNLLLLFVPVALILRYLVHASALMTFAASALAIIPLAASLGDATEDLAAHVGARLGALLNATLGNATELIIGVLMLRAGHIEIVKASLSGSIIGNTLLVLGMSAFFGGLGKQKQTFSRTTATVHSTTLFVAVAALIVPAIYSFSVFGRLRSGESHLQTMGVWSSVVLILLYGLNLVAMLSGPSTPADLVETERIPRSKGAALLSLCLATIALAFVSEVLVGTVEQSRQALGLSPVFMGVVVVAIVGNAAEHAAAITFARRDKMELALGITVGSSVQIALLVAPLLVFISHLVHQPMSLVFTPLEIGGITLAALITAMISFDGETTWFEGAQLIAVYLLFGIALYFMPESAGP